MHESGKDCILAKQPLDTTTASTAQGKPGAGSTSTVTLPGKKLEA